MAIPGMIAGGMGVASTLASLLGGGDKTRMKKLPTVSPEQEGYINQLLQGVGELTPDMFNYLSQILSDDPELMKQFEAPAMRQFDEEIVPGIAERFSALGAGSQRSSAFPQQIAAAGSRLSENLAAQRANLKSGAMGQLASLGQTGLTPTFGYQPKTKQGWGSSMGQLGGGLLGMLPRLFSGGF